MKDINIICACSDLGVHVNGANLAPKQLIKKLENPRIKKITTLSCNSNYKKELDFNNKKKNLDEVNNFNSNLYNEILKSDLFPLTLGGDHSIAIASALASIKKHDNLGILWFDAHGDFNTFESTTSGNIHGLPFAALTNYEKKFLTDFHKGNYYNFKNAVLVGARDIDQPHELENLKKAGITIFTTEDIYKYGADKIYEKAFEIASNGTNGIHISYDLDVIDPQIAPGVSIPAKDGLNLDQAFTFVDYIIQNKDKIKSLDLVELNPLNDINNKTEEIALQILDKLLKNI